MVAFHCFCKRATHKYIQGFAHGRCVCCYSFFFFRRDTRLQIFILLVVLFTCAKLRLVFEPLRSPLSKYNNMGISVPMAYKIIRRLNDELVAPGYIIVSGRISRSYFEKKISGSIA